MLNAPNFQPKSRFDEMPLGKFAGARAFMLVFQELYPVVVI